MALNPLCPYKHTGFAAYILTLSPYYLGWFVATFAYLITLPVQQLTHPDTFTETVEQWESTNTGQPSARWYAEQQCGNNRPLIVATRREFKMRELCSKIACCLSSLPAQYQDHCVKRCAAASEAWVRATWSYTVLFGSVSTVAFI